MGTTIDVQAGGSVTIVVGANLFRVCPFWTLPTLKSADETVEVFRVTFDTAQEVKVGTFTSSLFLAWLGQIKGVVSVEHLGATATP